MSPCDPMAMRRLLRDELSDDETIQLEEHLCSCAGCRNELESANGQDQEIRHVVELLSSSVEVPNGSNMHSIALGSWIQTDYPTNSTGTGSPFDDSPDLSILTPSEDPAFLGRIGNYEVQGIIGRGGMGLVFRALDRSLNRHVAIKVLDPALASVGSARQRFGMEARAMAAISHEHVVPVYSVDVHRGLPYFAMEYIPGGTLEARVREQGPLDLMSTLQIARQVAHALAAAHECGLVHRDIKPANILLDRGVERVRVADFGLARVSSDASFTRSGFIAGTPQFMSPEQVRGDVCTELSDLFSLGSVMYAMCTGHSPFRSDSMYGSMQRVVYDTPKSIVDQVPHVPVWLENLIFKLLAKNPESRFNSAIELATLLELEIAHLQNPSRFPRPVRREYRTKHTTNKTRMSRVALGLLLVASMIGTIAWISKLNQTDWNAKKSASHPNAASSTMDVAKPPNSSPPGQDVLWNNDGLDTAWKSAYAIEKSFHGSDAIPISDVWSLQLQELSRQLRQAEQESR